MIEFPENMPLKKKLWIVLFFPYLLFECTKERVVSISFALLWSGFFIVIGVLMLQLDSEEILKYLLPTYVLYNVLTYNFIDAMKQGASRTSMWVTAVLFLFASLVNGKIITDCGVHLYTNSPVPITHSQIGLMVLSIALAVYIFLKMFRLPKST